ncbi:uncharacterized protein LOC124939834 [Impatiens glandulifera]|uniref:uncharacterized protein LOC124939834 n=1 Tax=Impatiens glandulifera TaxID=253017 RepID=UPI001FB09BF2|nr:uncharacterized protein LOC124939834 [Impatiens glandulifera]XP_047336245.1 uncharacterized protein LOC124939834 [Impatiens glandulifera]
MAKGTRGRRRISSRQYRSSPYPLSSSSFDQDDLPKKCSRLVEKKDWEDATCSVCMECPHNAVLLLCSSHDKGCRPYMCGTSFRYSNCLDQYKKAYTKVTSSSSSSILQSEVHSTNPTDPRSLNETEVVVVDKCEVGDLACPLCRGQVKGWTIVEPAREFLNEKKRSCMQDNCSYVGKYKELRKHMKGEHPSARPREVDPGLEQKWRRLERDREREDVMSTIRSTMPGAMVFGDYVIEGGRFGMEGGGDDDGGRDGDDVVARNEGLNNNNSDSNLFNVFLLLHAFGPGGMQNRLARRHEQQHQQLRGQAGFGPSDEVIDSDEDDDDGEVEDDEDGGGGMSLVSRLRRHGRVLLGRSGRRRRRREAGER